MDTITTAQLRTLGHTDHEIGDLVRAGELRRLRRGVYLRTPVEQPRLSADEQHRASVRAALVVRHDDVLASHASAGVFWGLPLRRAALDTVHLTAPTQRRGKTRPGERVASAAVSDDDRASADGVACTSPARTVLDLARTEPSGWALAAADHALRTGLVTRDDLDSALRRLGGVRGVQRARRVVAKADARSGSAGESLSRDLFIEAGLAPDDLQRQFHYEGCLDIVDFWWSPRLAGEFDGRLKYRAGTASGRSGEDVLWSEKQREDRLRRQGILFVRWTWDELFKRPDEVLARVRQGVRDTRGMIAA